MPREDCNNDSWHRLCYVNLPRPFVNLGRPFILDVGMTLDVQRLAVFRCGDYTLESLSVLRFVTQCIIRPILPVNRGNYSLPGDGVRAAVGRITQL